MLISFLLLPEQISPAGGMVARKTSHLFFLFPKSLRSLEVVGSSPTLGNFLLFLHRALSL